MLAFARAPGRTRPHHRAGEPLGRNRRRRARARRHAAAAAEDARRAEAPRRSRPRRLQDQPRHAQHPGLGAADVATGCAACSDPTVQAFAPKLLRALDRAVVLFGRRARLRPHAGGAAVAPAAAAADSWSTRCRPARRRRAPAASSSTTRSTPASRSTPIPSSCSACSPISVRNADRRRWPPTTRAALVRRLTDFGRAHRQRQPHPGHRHRPRPAAEGARKPVRGLPRLRPQRRHGPWPGDRPRAGARAWRHPRSWSRAPAAAPCFRSPSPTSRCSLDEGAQRAEAAGLAGAPRCLWPETSAAAGRPTTPDDCKKFCARRLAFRPRQSLGSTSHRGRCTTGPLGRVRRPVARP